jgi:hypothetical protein
MSERVTVYSFVWYDGMSDTSAVSHSKRTADEIAKLGLKLLEHTKQVVNVSELDSEGRYLPK